MAAELAEKMAAVERVRVATTASLEAIKSLHDIELHAVFGADNAGPWPRRPLGQLLASPLKTGISKPMQLDGDVHCLTLSAVRNGLLDLSASHPVAITDEEAKRNWIKPDVFYVVRGNGNLSLVGRGALAPTLLTRPTLYPDLLIEVDFDRSTILGDYLRWVWDSPQLRSHIEARARTSAGIYKINQSNLSRIPLPVPPLPVQEQIALLLSRRMAEVKRLRTLTREQLAEIQALPTSLLRLAFSGKL